MKTFQLATALTLAGSATASSTFAPNGTALKGRTFLGPCKITVCLAGAGPTWPGKSWPKCTVGQYTLANISFDATCSDCNTTWGATYEDSFFNQLAKGTDLSTSFEQGHYDAPTHYSASQHAPRGIGGSSAKIDATIDPKTSLLTGTASYNDQGDGPGAGASFDYSCSFLAAEQ